MYVTVVVVGIPQYVAYNDVAFNLKKLLDVRTEPFELRDLRETKHRRYKWQFALDFKSKHEAKTAQDLLHGYNYILPNGIAYVLCAKLTEDPELMREEKSLVRTARSRSSSCDEDWAILGLVPKASDNDLHRTFARMDAQIEFLNKQKLLVQAERELLRERRQLWKEYNRRDDSDSDHDIDRRRTKSPRNSNSRSRRRYKCRSKYPREAKRPRSVSRDGFKTFSSTSKLRDFPNDGLILPPTTYYSEKRPYSDLCTSECTSYDMLLHQSQNCFNGKNEFSFKPTINEYDDVDQNTVASNPPVALKHTSKEDNMKSVISETIQKIIKEMDAILDKVCYEKNINILEKGLNFTILRKLKYIIKGRVENLNISNDMSSSVIIVYYRRCFSRTDDKQLIENIIDEYLVENPHVQNKRIIEPIAPSESSLNLIDSAENIMWRAVDEVLRDIKIETISSEDDEETKMNVEDTIRPDYVESPQLKEVIDITHEPLVDPKNNREVELIVVFKNSKTNVLNKITGNKQNEVNTITTDSSVKFNEYDNKIISPNPTFYITLKAIMRQMKYQIKEFEQVTGVRNLKIIVERDIRDKIMVLLKGKPYMKSTSITKLFREYYPRKNDKDLIRRITEDNMKNIKIHGDNQTENKVAIKQVSVAT